MNKRWQELHEIAAQRASEAKTPESLMHGIAGAETGWVVAKETEVIGKKGEERLQVVEVEVDTALLKEIRDLEVNAAREVGGQFEDVAKEAGSRPGGDQRVQVNINFPAFIPVHLTYQTAFVDDAGKLQIRDDVYGRDARMIAILKGTEHKIADMPMDRPRPSFSTPVRMPPGTIGITTYARGPSFFDALFGGIGAVPPQPATPRQKSAKRAHNNVR